MLDCGIHRWPICFHRRRKGKNILATSLYCRQCGTHVTIDTQFCPTCGIAQARSAHSSTYVQRPATPMFNTGTLPTTHILNQRYRLIETVGRGGMGAVYSAQDTQLGNRLVAVKEMSISGLNQQDVPLVTGQFRREALLLASLHHPHLPVIHEYFAENGRWYLVMSFVEGQNLQAILNATANKRLPVNEVLRIGIELCEVLEYLHTHEPPIIFRDLKPQNIMITPKGHICLIDFGIARHFRQEKVNDTAHFYSLGYAPPEQYGQSQTNPRSDIYSLGATLHQMLSGHNPANQPFKFSSLQLLDPTIPFPLARLVMQMVEMDEWKRPPDVAMIKRQLEQMLIAWQHEPVRNTQAEPATNTWEEASYLSRQEQVSPSSRHAAPTVHNSTAYTQPPQAMHEDRLKARPIVRRSILIGLFGTLVAASGGAFMLSHSLIQTKPTKNSMGQTPKQADKIVPAPTAAPAPTPTPSTVGNSMSWTDIQQVAGQASQATPALTTSSNGILHLVFVASNIGNSLLYTSSQDKGTTWGNYRSIPNQSSKTTPALTLTKNGVLHLIFVANNVGNGLLYTSSPDNASTWSNAAYIGQASKSAPALVVAKNGTLHLIFVANNNDNGLFYMSSQDKGATWGNYRPIPGQASKTAPALVAAQNGTLHLVFVANNIGNGLLYMSSQDNGATWSDTSYTGQGSLLAPALAILNNTLYLAFVANDGSNQLCIISSQDGKNWTSKQKVGQASLLAPALTVLNNTLYLAFVAIDGSNQLCIISAK